MLERLGAGPVTDGERPIADAPAQDVTRMLAAEGLGAGLLAFLTVGAGLLAERYSAGNIGLAILITGLSAAGGFAALARVMGDAAPSLFNPAFAFALVLSGRMPLASTLLAGAAQMAAACLGVMLAHMVTNTGLVQIATQIQSGVPVWTGEVIASALVMFVLLRLRAAGSRAEALFGGLGLLAVILATPSLSTVNPAVTLARGLTDSFTSIRLADAGLILACQFSGALGAALLSAWLFPKTSA